MGAGQLCTVGVRKKPREAFCDWVPFILEQQPADLAFSDVILSADGGGELFRAEVRRALRASRQRRQPAVPGIRKKNP